MTVRMMDSNWIFWMRPEGCGTLDAEKYENVLQEIQDLFPDSQDPIFTVRWYEKEDMDAGGKLRINKNQNILAAFACQPLNGAKNVTQYWSLYRCPRLVSRRATEYRLDTTECARAFVEFSLNVQAIIVRAFPNTFGLYLDQLLSNQTFYIKVSSVLSRGRPLPIESDGDGLPSKNNFGGAGNRKKAKKSPLEWSSAEINCLLNVLESEKLDIKKFASQTNYLSKKLAQSRFIRTPSNIRLKVRNFRKRYRRDLASGRPSTWIFFLRIERLMKLSPTKDEDEGDGSNSNADGDDSAKINSPEITHAFRESRRTTSPVGRGEWSYEETRCLLHIVEDLGYDLLNLTSIQYGHISRVLKRRYKHQRFANSIKDELDKLVTTYRREAKGTNSTWRCFFMVDKLIRKSLDFESWARHVGITSNDFPMSKVDFDGSSSSIPVSVGMALNPLSTTAIGPTTDQVFPTTGEIVGCPVHTAKRELLRVNGPIPIAWILATGGSYPDHHVESDRHGHLVTLVARAEFEGVELPAQLQTDGSGGPGACYIHWGTTMQEVYSYEVLVGPPGVFSWVSSANGEFVGDAIIGGRSRTGEALFVGRCIDTFGRKIPGIVLPSRGLCYIIREGHQVGVPSYEILVIAA